MESAGLKMIVGLGNPGSRYDGTRHNVGFEVLGELAKRLNTTLPKTKFEGEITTTTYEQISLLLLRPLTYMNASGRCVQAVANFYKVKVEEDLLVVCDDLTLPLGKLRMRASGSGGGQKGLADILRAVSSQNVPRLRIGIDPTPENWETADYVLSKFPKNDRTIIDQSVIQAADAALMWATQGIAHCMNKIN